MFCNPAVDGKTIVITGGVMTAAGDAALSRAPILGVDVTAQGSAAIDGRNPAEYVEEDNDTYKWFKSAGAPGSKTLVTAVAFTVEEPAAGAIPAERVQIAAEPEGALTIEEYRAVWLESEDGMDFVPMATPIFEAGKYYAVEEPNEKNAGGPVIALAASGYAVSTEFEKEPVYTINGEETTLIFSYLDIFGPLEDVACSITVSPKSVSITAEEGYSEEDIKLYKEITATSTGEGTVDFIMGGFKESSMYEQFGLIVGGMTATVYPKAGLAEGVYNAVVVISDFYDRYEPVEVPVTFTVRPQGSGPSSEFTDVDPDAWYAEYVDYAVENGLMNGVGGGRFDPQGATTRAMIVTILWRLEGEPVVNAINPFDDVENGVWYTDAIVWAADNGIVEGYGNGKFGPNDDITREQLATILYRYAKYKGYDVSAGEDTNILSYDDALDVSSWAMKAMQWAVAEGIINGRTASTLAPQGGATRAETAAMLMRFAEGAK